MMKRMLALGLGLLFLGSCGVAPQLTVKSRRYQKGLFVQLSWKQTKVQAIKNQHRDPSFSNIPSFKVNSPVSQWWTLQKEGVASLSTVELHKQDNVDASNNIGTILENDPKSEISQLYADEKPTFEASPKLQKKHKKLIKEALRSAPRGDDTLSLLSLIMGAGGFLLILLSWAIPFFGLLSLLAFIAGIVLGIIALNKEGSNAKAIVGLILSSVGCLLWGVLLLLVGTSLLFAAAALAAI